MTTMPRTELLKATDEQIEDAVKHAEAIVLRGLRLLGAAAYLLGVLAVTAACNLPRNEALAALGLDAPGLPGAWQRYLGEWTAWNHVRCAAALLAALALAAARE